MGQGRTRGARVYLQCFLRNEAAAGNNSTPDAGAAGPGAPGRVVETQVSALIREESGILLANIDGLFPLRARHKIGVLREMADEGGIFMIALPESHLRKISSMQKLQWKDSNTTARVGKKGERRVE
jgi:hypothetical protein